MLTIVSLVASLTCDSPTCSSEASHGWRLRALAPVGVTSRMPDVSQVNWHRKYNCSMWYFSSFSITQCDPVVVTFGELPHFQVFATTLLSGTMYTLSDPFSPSTQSPLSSPLCSEHNRCANYNEGTFSMLNSLCRT